MTGSLSLSLTRFNEFFDPETFHGCFLFCCLYSCFYVNFFIHYHRKRGNISLKSQLSHVFFTFLHNVSDYTNKHPAMFVNLYSFIRVCTQTLRFLLMMIKKKKNHIQFIKTNISSVHTVCTLVVFGLYLFEHRKK